MGKRGTQMKIGNEIPNVKYKDRLFRFVFGENKEWLLSLYNAVNETQYDNPNDITITTLDDVIYVKMKNDVSLLLDSELSLYEHQSTYNLNMPLRGFLYFASLYKALLTERGIDLYGKRMVKIPRPQYIVFYNGNDYAEDMIKLKLSEAYEKKSDSNEFEWTATMYNINQGHNEDIMSQCKALSDYAKYVDKVKSKLRQGMKISIAVKEAVNEAVEEELLEGFFQKHEKGVLEMSLTEFNEEEFVANRRAEGREEGRTELIENALLKLKSVKDVAELLGVSVEEVKKVEGAMMSKV